jgi:hypothetical protein
MYIQSLAGGGPIKMDDSGLILLFVVMGISGDVGLVAEEAPPRRRFPFGFVFLV